jgi:hypothetical protein
MLELETNPGNKIGKKALAKEQGNSNSLISANQFL